MRARICVIAIVSLVALTAMGVACKKSTDTGGGGGTPSETTSEGTGENKVTVTVKDFAIAPDPTSAAAGSITFDVKNAGPSTHEFVVFLTDLAPDQLPTASDGTVDEEGTGVKHIDEIEDIGASEEKDLTVDLTAGKYVLICNLPGHYAAGMHAAFTVA